MPCKDHKEGLCSQSGTLLGGDDKSHKDVDAWTCIAWQPTELAGDCALRRSSRSSQLEEDELYFLNGLDPIQESEVELVALDACEHQHAEAMIGSRALGILCRSHWCAGICMFCGPANFVRTS